METAKNSSLKISEKENQQPEGRDFKAENLEASLTAADVCLMVFTFKSKE